MRAGETELQMCVRHVAEQEDRVARQDVRVEHLREGGSHLLGEGLGLLAEMRDLLKTNARTCGEAPPGRFQARRDCGLSPLQIAASAPAEPLHARDQYQTALQAAPADSVGHSDAVRGPSTHQSEI
jgi:hypothetical protein